MDESSKTNLPISTKDMIPKSTLDKGLFVIMVLGIPTIALWKVALLLRYHSDFNFVFCLHIALLLFILMNIVGNLYYLKRIDSSIKGKILPSVLLPMWRYCHFCQMNSPPRSYHCAICDECILKRDQHCMFVGSCVGYYNHRHYLMAVMYIMIGSSYVAIYQWYHCLEAIGGFHVFTIFALAAPHMAALLGFLTLYGFIIATLQVILSVTAVLTCYLIVVQFICISSGQTIHERKAGITLYDLGWRKNFEQVLGKKWYLAVVCPFLSSSVTGDGLKFPTYYDLEEIKNV